MRNSPRLVRWGFVLVLISLCALFPSPGYASDSEVESIEGTSVAESSDLAPQVEFYLIESPTVYEGGSERVVVAFSNVDDLEQARLSYEQMDSHQTYTVDSTRVTEDGAALFEIEFSDSNDSGRYRLVTATAVRKDGAETEANLGSDSDDSCVFAFALGGGEADSETSYRSMGSSGKLVWSDSIDDAQEVASESTATPRVRMLMAAPSRKASSDPYQKQQLVIALDAGHSNVGHDTGASGNGMKEENLTLAIAQAARERLSSYANVKVVWCRPSDEFSMDATTAEDLKERVRIAAAANADLYVSFHINASGGDNSSAQGLEVYIPNKQSFHRDYFDIGSELGQRVINKLTALSLDGLTFTSRGVFTRNYDDGAIYSASNSPETTQWDYLSVIRNSRTNNIPAILIEHGFIDNTSHDAVILSDSENLKQMGYADADAIADYYGLGMSPCPMVTSLSNGTVSLSWDAVSWATKYSVAYRVHQDNQDVATGWSTINEVTDTSITLDGLQNGATYDFLVQGGKDNTSGSTRWTTYGQNDILTVTLVPSPQHVGATAPKTDGVVHLSWDAVDGADAYAIAEKVGDNYSTFTTSCTTTTYDTPSLSAGKEHRFLVQARVNGTWSRVSDDLLVSVTPDGITKPVVTAKLSGSSCDLSWDAVPGATRYAVAKQTGSGWQTYTYNYAGTSFHLDGLAPNLEYRFVVQAYIDGAWSAFGGSDVVSVTYDSPNSPTKPQVTATFEGNSCRLSWDSVSRATRYAVAKRVGSSWVTYTYNCAETHFDLSSLEAGRTYEFLVQAFVDGQWTSFTGNDVVSVRYDIPHPRVTATLSGSSCDLSWDAVPGATRYAVAKQTGSGWQTYTYNYAGTSFHLDGLTPNQEYRFLVQAYVGGSWSAFDTSDIVSVTYRVAFAPGNVTATAGNGSVTLQWSRAAIPVEAYVVYQEELGSDDSVTRNSGSFRLLQDNVTSTSCTVSGLTNGRCYKFLVQSRVNGVYSSYDTDSDVISVIPTANTPILGASQVSHQRMVADYGRYGGTYPAGNWESTPDIGSFVSAVETAAQSQGVRAEVLYAQAMLETGYLHFGGDVKPEQCNFGGIGATGGGDSGNSFTSVLEGLTAQAQHLRLYAGESPVGTVVDPRSFDSIRGEAPDVEHLTGTWAMNSSYGATLISMLNRL